MVEEPNMGTVGCQRFKYMRNGVNGEEPACPGCMAGQPAAVTGSNPATMSPGSVVRQPAENARSWVKAQT